MTRTEILLTTAKKYSDLARTNKITNAKKLSQCTFEIRENSDHSLIYLGVHTTNTCYEPRPVAKQKEAYDCLVRNSDMMGDLLSAEGFVTLYVNVLEVGKLESGFEILVEAKHGTKKAGNRKVEVLFKEVFKP